ncbi:MAG: UDP-N-acetylmuramoyl-L-alanine--D-glutamate ligase [Treponema sp.]|jgi:UDP-N-acetylmuramoylalanine--D-glutamate ligase|nr:UDP-N-acetylmuramoyl-L-alanine--D-glutamate ligase [Treponema sp.]
MDYSGVKALVMGLGLHGGGLETSRFLLKRGACLTVTDLRDEKTLSPSMERLDAACGEEGFALPHYVLGKHQIEDFEKADIVIKNPGAPSSSPYLQAAKRIETDISLFLAESEARLFAVTGSKGKSCAASALCRVLQKANAGGRAFLGGNITVSPLSFLDNLTANDSVVLELSSWQLGDLKGRKNDDSRPLLKPRAAVITAIMPDHLDRYASMEEYVNDKRVIYEGQDSEDITVAGDDAWGLSFRRETRGKPLVYAGAPLAKGGNGGWIENGVGFARLGDWPGVRDETAELVPEKLLVEGAHQKMNLLAAALAAYGLGIDAEKIRLALADFPGVEHRLEFFHETEKARFYNDSAATIPQAAAACADALACKGPLVLVTGGQDKNLDFSPLVNAAAKASAVILLAGTGSEKLKRLFNEAGVSYSGPYDDLDAAVRRALNAAVKGSVIALSPGCASFGMFAHEFDRGRKWKEACLRLS